MAPPQGAEMGSGPTAPDCALKAEIPDLSDPGFAARPGEGCSEERFPILFAALAKQKRKCCPHCPPRPADRTPLPLEKPMTLAGSVSIQNSKSSAVVSEGQMLRRQSESRCTFPRQPKS